MYVQKSRYFIVSNNAVTSVLTVVFTYYSFLWSYNQGQALCPDDVASPHLNSPNSRASTPVPFPPRVVLQLTEHCCSSSSPCLFTLPSIHPFYLLCLFFLQMDRPKKPLLLSEQQKQIDQAVATASAERRNALQKARRQRLPESSPPGHQPRGFTLMVA